MVRSHAIEGRIFPSFRPCPSANFALARRVVRAPESLQRRSPFHALTGQQASAASLTAAPPMERSRAVESLDSLWFFSNVLSRARPLPSAAEAEETYEKEGGGGGGGHPIKNQANGPEDEAEAARAKPVAQSGESSLPRCPGCGNLDPEAAELGAVGTPESAEEEEESRMRRSKRRQRSKRTFCGEDLSGFEENHRLGNYSRGFGAASEIQAMKKKMLPPLSDGVAMREHLRSWAIAVACAIK